MSGNSANYHKNMTLTKLAEGNKLSGQISATQNALNSAEKLTHQCNDWSASIHHLSKEDAKEVKELIKRTLQRKITSLEVQLHTL